MSHKTRGPAPRISPAPQIPDAAGPEDETAGADIAEGLSKGGDGTIEWGLKTVQRPFKEVAKPTI